MYIYFFLFKHFIATGYVTVMENKCTLDHYKISLNPVTSIFKQLLVKKVCKVYLENILVLITFRIVKLRNAPTVRIITFPIDWQNIVIGSTCISGNHGYR